MMKETQEITNITTQLTKLNLDMNLNMLRTLQKESTVYEDINNLESTVVEFDVSLGEIQELQQKLQKTIEDSRETIDSYYKLVDENNTLREKEQELVNKEQTTQLKLEKPLATIEEKQGFKEPVGYSAPEMERIQVNK